MTWSRAWTSYVLVLHGGPVVLPRGGIEPRRAEGRRGTLDELGLLAEREPLSASWKDERQWGEPEQITGQRGLLLQKLIVKAEFDAGIGFGVSVNNLQKMLQGEREHPLLRDTVHGYLVGVRATLRADGSGNPVPRWGQGRGEKLSLNSHMVRCDWFDVLAAEMSAERADDPYEKAHALSLAERAYVESLRLTPPTIVETTRRHPPSYLPRVVRKRWKLREAYLRTLLKIGHTDTMVTEFRLWRSLAVEAASTRPGMCRDETLGVGFTMKDASGRPTTPLNALGSIEVEGTRLEDLANDLPDVAVPTVAALSRIRRAYENAKENARTRTNSAIRRDDQIPRVKVPWRDVDIMLRQVLVRLKGIGSAGFMPQVIIGLGRGGSVVAASLSDALPCRAVGSISIDRYNYDGSPGTGTPYLRGADLPDKRGCRVLVCDDVITSGKTVQKAIDEVIRPHYPSAHIVVASLVLNTRAIPLEPVDDWLGGVEVRVEKEEEFWLDFYWRNLGSRA